MSLNPIRNFSSTAKRTLLKLIGKVTIDDVRTINGSKGDQWVSAVHSMRDAVEAQYDTVVEYEINGAKAHKSSLDPADPEEVISLAFYSKSGTRFLGGHVHENGTYKLAESRAGKGKGKGKSE